MKNRYNFYTGLTIGAISGCIATVVIFELRTVPTEAQHRELGGIATKTQDAAAQVSQRESAPVEKPINVSDYFSDRDALRGIYEFRMRLKTATADDMRREFAKLGKIYPVDKRRQYRDELLMAWGRIDPAAAQLACMELPGEERERAIRSVLRGWAYTDPAGAARWVTSIYENTPSKTRIMNPNTGRFAAIMESLTDQGNAGQVIDLILRNPTVDNVEGLSSAFATRWARTDFASAAKWYESIPAGDIIRPNVLKGLIGALTEEDPDIAYKFTQSLKTESERVAGYLALVDTMSADGSLSRCADLLMNIPADAVADQAKIMFVVKNAERDSDLAMRLLASVGPSKSRGNAAARVVDAVLPRSPEDAAAIAVNYIDGETRLRVLKDVVKVWAKKDAVAAAEFVNRSPLNDSEKAGVIGAMQGVTPKR